MIKKFINMLKIKRHSVVYSWIYSYVAVVLLFVTLFIFLFVRVQTYYENEINRSNKYLLEHTRTNLDKIINDLRVNASDIALDTKIRNILNYTKDLSDDQHYEAYEIATNLKKIMSLNRTIDDIFILNLRQNVAITRGGTTSIKDFYKLKYAGNTDYEQWLKEFEYKSTESYFTSVLADNGAQRKELINYVRSLSLSDPKDLSFCVVIMIDKSRLLSQMSEMQRINNSNFYIIDPNERIIVSTDKEKYNGLKYSDFKGESGVTRQNRGVQKYVISYIRSGINKWMYVCETNEASYRHELVYMQFIALVTLLIGLLLGGGLISFFIKRNYSPVFALMNLFNNQGNDVLKLDADEFSAIKKAIQKTLQDKSILDKQIHKQKMLLRNRFIERLLSGHSQNENIPVSEALHSYDIELNSDLFAVMLFFVEEYDNSNLEKGDYEEYYYHEIVFILTNVVEELVAAHHYGIMVECEDSLACLVNINNERKAEAIDDLMKVAEKAQQFIEQHFKINFTVAISSIHEGIDKVNITYAEALDVMKYKQVLGIKEIMCYDDIKDMNSGTYYYPFEKEQQLANCLKGGNYADSVKLIDEIFEKNLEKQSLTSDLAQCLILNLAATMIRTVNEMSGLADHDFLNELNPIGQLLPCKTIEEMKKQLYGFMMQICTHINNTKKENINWVKKDVVPFVEQNYSNANLSVSLIAEHFGVHPVYISRLFKEQMGEGLLEFISRIRIEKAKALLSNTDYTLNELALMVGYTNAHTFSRIFKKFEGITPGKYREISS